MRRRAASIAASFAVSSLALLSPGRALADGARIAVATNFTVVMERLEADFEEQSGYQLGVTAASTGLLYAQIRSGAPFDVFLAADQRRPRLLEEEGLAVRGSRFTYAVGRLTLWSTDPELIAEDGAATLRKGNFRTLAIANPKLAPYGLAARETLKALGLFATLQDRIVMGENIGQTHAMVATRNAELGFVALSYVLGPKGGPEGSRWDVPQELYQPIRQDAVLLSRAADNAAAAAFLAWLEGADASRVIHELGYGTEG